MADKKNDDAVQPNGLPYVWEEQVNTGAPDKVPMFGFTFTVVKSIVGVGIAAGIHIWGDTAKYDAKLALLQKLDLAPLLLTPTIYYLLNSFGMFHAIMHRCAAPVNHPNQHIYKVAGNTALPYVLMENEGAAGKFNRAQRAYANIMENAPLVLATALLGGFVYPHPMIRLMGIWACLRVVYCVMYTGSHKGRALGFALCEHFIYPIMHGLVFLAFAQMTFDIL